MVEPAVIDRLFYETRGQPGLTCWMGELLTETYNRQQPAITAHDFETTYAAALNVLPNNNILNIISKVKPEPYQHMTLELFKTAKKIPFKYDNEQLNYLYLNGVIDRESEDGLEFYVKFANPFVQKRLFNYFADDLFPHLGRLYSPFDNLEDTITAAGLNLERLLRRYEQYLQQNRVWLFKEAPRRRTDLRIYEAVYHFNLYMYLSHFLSSFEGQVYPEFPAGNGQIDLIISYAGQTYGLELKSFTNQREYRQSLKQAARYGQQLKLEQITLAFFVDYIDEENRRTYEARYVDEETEVMVKPIFVATGE